MGQMKRNHWVPKAYLKSFAADPKREKIWRGGKNQGDAELKPIEKVAVQFYLYTPKDSAGNRDYRFEEKLSRMENFFGSPVWIELCTGMISLKDQALRQTLGLIVAIFYMRHPYRFEGVKNIHSKIVEGMSKWFESPNEFPVNFEYKGEISEISKESWSQYSNASEDDLKKFWIQQIQAIEWLAEILMKMRWSVIFSEEPVFITSDNPVTIYPGRNFKDPETKIFFPLSPTRVLIMDYDNDQPNGLYYPLKANPSTLNYLIWNNEIEHIFSHTDPNILCAEIIRNIFQ